MAIGDVIVSATDYNRSVQELSDLHDTLYDLKKEFENIHSVFNVDKETLQNKISNVENIFNKIDVRQNNSTANLLEVMKTIENYKEQLEKIFEELEIKEGDLKVRSDENFKDLVIAMENHKKENLERLEKRNKDYILQINNLNANLNATYNNLNSNLLLAQETNTNIEQNHKNFTKDFDKKHSILIIFSMSLVFVSAFVLGFFVKHQLMMSQLKNSVPLSTFQSVLPFIEPFF